MKGHIFKIHSDFYYTNTEKGVFECKIREVLKKQKEQIFVGDYVELEQINDLSKQAFISKVLKRENFIPRPKVANINQVIIVSAIKEPDLDFEQLNRYLCFCEYYNLNPILCFNKNDLEGEEEIIANIKQIYTPLDYELIFTSALEGNGIESFKKLLEGKTTVLCGSSGVGKSSLVNALAGEEWMATGEIQEWSGKGRHTTTSRELVMLPNGAMALDTPGLRELGVFGMDGFELKGRLGGTHRFRMKG